LYFVFKPENFHKTDGVCEKDFVPLVTTCFVKKKCFRNETSSYSLLVSVMALSREKQI